MDPVRDAGGRGYHLARLECIKQGVAQHMMGLHRAVIARRNVAPLLLLGVATKATWRNSRQKEHRSTDILAGTADACKFRC
jgi:hypothetical protein